MKFFLMVVSFLATAVLMRLWFGDWLIAWVVAVSAFLHELGHWLMLRRYGQRPAIVFLLLMAFVTSDPTRLTRRQKAMVAMAGPLVTFVLVLLGWLGYLVSQSETAAAIGWLNALLLLGNLIPALGLDGEKWLEPVFASFAKNDPLRGWYGRAVYLSIIVVGAILDLSGRPVYVTALVMVGIIIWQVVKLSWKTEWDREQALSAGATTALVATYTTMVIMGMLAVTLLPAAKLFGS